MCLIDHKQIIVDELMPITIEFDEQILLNNKPYVAELNAQLTIPAIFYSLGQFQNIEILPKVSNHIEE
jgi:hypothetical protein